MMTRKILFCFGLTVMLAGSILAQSDPIANLREQWQRAWNAGQLDQVAALYANDAVLLPPTGERIVGRTAIHAYFQKQIDQEKTQISNNSKSEISISSQNSEVAATLGVDRGIYKETIQWPGSSLALTGVGGSGVNRREIEGNYLVVVKRHGSNWLIQEHASTVIAPK
jgi:ketosteroid isomerase-like protein